MNGDKFITSRRVVHGDLITIIDRSFRFEFPPGSAQRMSVIPGNMMGTPKTPGKARTPLKALTPKVVISSRIVN